MMWIPLGPYSDGSLRQRDLEYALSAALDALAARNPQLRDQLRAIDELPYDDAVERLNDLLPHGVYYGGHYGDPACVGIWVDWDAVEWDSAPVISDPRDAGDADWALVVGPHGDPLGAVDAGGAWLWRAC